MIPLAIGSFVTLLALGLFRLTRQWLAERRRRQRIEREFWARQSRDAVTRLVSGAAAAIPAPLEVLQQHAAVSSTVQAIVVARELGMLRFLDDRPGTTAAELAAHFGFVERPVRAWVELLAAAGVLEGRDQGLALTEAARFYLYPESPFFDSSLPAASISRSLLHTLRSGSAGGSKAKWSEGSAHHAALWGPAMHRFSFPLGFALDASGLLAGRRAILDVAGGIGSMCVALALRDPSRQLTLLELPGSVDLARQLTDRYGVADRVRCVGGDMFQVAWPDGFDAVLFTNIFHDWNDERCLELARRAYASLKPGGLVLVQEALLDEDRPGPLWTAHFSLMMALDMEARQFRPSELRDLLAQAGFVDLRVTPLLGYNSSVVGARPVTG
ncbi:methyltransferase [Sorangium sp. So ce394]|uniref:methyltransferase n=1 Tax=Sorangium sp. So ce394 TaxID=3133310 RepID=UPI003F5B9FA2